MLIPISADHVVGKRGDHLHAVVTRSLHHKDRRFKDPRKQLKTSPPHRWATACGARCDAIVTGETTDGDKVVLCWPPYVTTAVGDRCYKCWLATGEPRPDAMWKKP